MVENQTTMFQLGGIVFTLFNVAVWFALRRRLVTAFPRRARLLTFTSALLFVVALHPALFMAMGSWSAMRALQPYLPDWLLMSAVGAQFAVIFYGLFLGAKGAPVFVANTVRRLRRLLSRQARGTAPERALVDESRRRMMARAALAVPLVAAMAGAGGVLASRQLPVVRRLRLPVARELSALHGVTIAQVSDLHIGSYMDAERLDDIRDAVNALGADFHVITGDLLDNHVNQLELASRFVRELQPRRGETFLCMGNHEYIAARSAHTETIVGGLEEAGGQMLLDEARPVRIGGHHLWLGAIDYPRGARGNTPASRPTRESLDIAVGQMRDDGAPRIVLSHHPRTFFEGREYPIDLMLSGHTHGGQIKAGRVGDWALTPILAVDFYHNGYYEHAGRRLYVNSGCGGWLPMRINCPPEITLVELVSV